MRRIIAVVEIETMRRGHCKYFLSCDHKCLSVNIQPTVSDWCLTEGPRRTHAWPRRSSAGSWPRRLPWSAARAASPRTGAGSLRQVTFILCYEYFVLLVGLNPISRTNQKQSESPGPCSAVQVEAASLAPRASARLFLISAITFCKGMV